jgi:hypothetical protein
MRMDQTCVVNTFLKNMPICAWRMGMSTFGMLAYAGHFYERQVNRMRQKAREKWACDTGDKTQN